MFSPQTEYIITPQEIPLEYFYKYKDAYVVRPPYQRKNVWPDSKQKALLDSLFRQYYVPKIVLREVRLDNKTIIREVIDGQQRIITAQRFYNNELKLPNSLSNLDKSLPGKSFSDLPFDIRQYVDTTLKYSADVIKNIDNPRNANHQEIASDIFWRLQQGVSLNFMETAHARLSSISRNFIVKYSDDITFDFNAYKPLDQNHDKHTFFSIIKMNNNRMQHLALMTRLLILEENGGAADINNKNVMEYIEKYQQEDGIGNMEFEKANCAKETLKNLSALAKVFLDDPMLEDEDEDDGSEIQELRKEYFIISVYMLLRHLKKHYVFAEDEMSLFHNFVIAFHARWRAKNDNDMDIIHFSDNRQQSKGNIETRDRIIRQIFFDYAKEKGQNILTKDDRRAFNESERISIYRRDNGLCQECLKENKSEKESKVPWNEYDADHVIPHSKGGQTEIKNAQLLCRYHNQKKGDRG